VGRAAVARQASLDIGVKGAPGLEGGVPTEDGVRGRRRELAAVVGVPGLEDDRTTLRRARHREGSFDVEVLVVVRERPGARALEKRPRSRVGHDGIGRPRVEELHRRSEELLRPGVAILLCQEPAPAEVLTGEGIPRGDDVPGRPTPGQVVE
jgi:hypothetical protein